MDYVNAFLRPERPFLLLQSLNNELCVDWFEDEEELKEHVKYYLATYGDKYMVKDAIEISSYREINVDTIKY